MATGHLVLLFVAVALLVLRIAQAILRRGEGSDEPTYPEPTLALDHANEAPHDVFGELESTLDADQAAEGRYLAAKQQTGEHVAAAVPISKKIVAAAGTLFALVAIPYLHPALSWFRLLSGPVDAPEAAPPMAATPLPEEVVGEWQVPEATYDQEGRARDLDAKTRETRGPIAQERETMPAAVDEDAPPRSLEDPSGKALDAFFAKLVGLERGDSNAQAHVLYYGDSVIASDFITGKLRRLLQTRFGDAGHGYALVANAWPGWFHYDVSRKASDKWRKSTCVGPYAEDGLYGLGCASFSAHEPGVWAEMGTNPIESYEWNQKVSRFEVEYLKQPGGGAIDLLVDGEKKDRIETKAAAPEVAWHVLEVPDGAHSLRIETVDDRPVRAFGVRMGRAAPGVTLSALGVTGARARFLDKQDDEHWKKVLAHTSADLVVLSFGGNEVQDGNKYPMEKYRETLEAVMVQVEKALPNASYMLVGPTDMASAKASQGHSLPMVYFIVEEQKKLAKKRGWAFWDQFRAMGGGGTMWAWIKQGLGNPDMFHPTGEGGGLLGKWEYLALMEVFEKYKAARR